MEQASSDDPSHWYTVLVTTTPDLAELAADALWAFGPPAVEERVGRRPNEVQLLAGFEGRYRADAAASAVSGAELGEVAVVVVGDSGLDAWRAFAEPITAGPFLLMADWLEVATDHDPEMVIRLDPETTFGSGSHPTTRLVVERLADLATTSRRVLDVGTGSGVLAIAAARLGADVTALDPDPASPRVVAANATLNDVTSKVGFEERPLGELAESSRHGGQHYGLVLANLLAPIVAELAVDLVDVTELGGYLVVSGLLEDRWQPTIDLLTAGGRMEARRVDSQDGWVAVTLQRTTEPHHDQGGAEAP